MAQRDALPSSRGFRFSESSAKGKGPPGGEYLVSSIARGGRESWIGRSTPHLASTPFAGRWLRSLVSMKIDVKTVQEILRHQNLKTTLEVYARAMSEDKLQAQGMFLEKLFSPDQKKKLPQDVVSAKDLERIDPIVYSLQ